MEQNENVYVATEFKNTEEEIIEMFKTLQRYYKAREIYSKINVHKLYC